MRAKTQVSLDGDVLRVRMAYSWEQYNWIKGWLMMYELQDSDMVKGMLPALSHGITAITAFDFDW